MSEHLDTARTLLAALPRRPDGLLITSDADVSSVAALVSLFRESGMGQRQWCAAVGLGATNSELSSSLARDTG